MEGELQSGEYRMVSWITWADGTNKTVGVVDASAADLARIEQRDYIENQGQEWTVTDLGDGEYSIINIHSGKALDVPYGVPNPGGPLWQYPYAGNNAQRWIIEYQGLGVYRIKSKLDTSLGMRVKDGSTANGTRIILDSLTSGDSYFMFYPVEYTTTKAVFIGLPDTQSYVEDVDTLTAPYYDRFTSQTDWILANKDQISLVLQQGDITNRNIPPQWELAQDAFFPLNNQVPYVLAVGNHDMGAFGLANDRNTDNFNQYFPYSTMSTLPAFGEVFEANKMDNAYYLLETGAYKWLIITLEFGPRASALAWADSLAKQYTDRTVILNTHSYMYFDDTRQGDGDLFSPHTYDFAKLPGSSVHDGEEMWEELVRGNPNIRFVLSGHVLGDGCGTLVSTNDAGYPVYQFLANFQDFVDGSEHGGDGYLREMELDFENEILIVKTYSAYPGIGFHPSQCHNFEIYPLEIVGL